MYGRCIYQRDNLTLLKNIARWACIVVAVSCYDNEMCCQGHAAHLDEVLTKQAEYEFRQGK